jgi:cyanophycinase
MRVVTVSADRPPRTSDLDGAGGVYVAGGLTPAYRDALVGDGTAWLDRARDMPYAGFSAGAAVAPSRALVGGWRTRYAGREVAVCAEECGEDLDALTVLPGLGLVPYLVDVHAAQWGTLHRLVYAVLDPANPAEGWAVDENTALEADGGKPVAVHGTGAATRVRRRTSGASASVDITVHLAGAL